MCVLLSDYSKQDNRGGNKELEAWIKTARKIVDPVAEHCLLSNDSSPKISFESWPRKTHSEMQHSGATALESSMRDQYTCSNAVRCVVEAERPAPAARWRF